MPVFPSPIVALAWTSATGQTVPLQGDPTGIRVNLVEGVDELPAVRAAEDVIPYLPGRLRQNGIADRRTLLLAGYVKTPTDLAYRGFIDVLKRALDPTVGAGVLTATLEDATVRTIVAVPRNIVYQGRIRTGKSLSIELDADPYWRGPAATPAALTVLTDPDDVVVPTLGTTPTLDAVVTVVGASSGAITVYNADGIGFGYPALTGGQTLIVNAGARTATIAGVSKRNLLTLLTPNRHGEFFRLRPVTDTVNVTGSPASISIAWSPTFL